MSDIKEKKLDSSLIDLLDFQVEKINQPGFINEDPIQFPRRFSDLRDIEIVSLLVSMIAWGNRKMICRDSERLLELMNNEPFLYMKNNEFETLENERNIHRTFFAAHLKYFLRGIKFIYARFPSLDAFAASIGADKEIAPAWKIAAEIQKCLSDANSGAKCPQCFPSNFQTTALKRFNMALRWLVRDDGIVDMGVWKCIDKSQLYIPLDVHVGNISRGLGILERKSNDRKAVDELTTVLRSLDNSDPVKYDFALFGMGIESKKVKD